MIGCFIVKDRDIVQGVPNATMKSACMNYDNASKRDAATLPLNARLSVNRCNLPAVILGSLTFQRHPSRLTLDGVEQFHADLFRRLDALDDHQARARQFMDYMSVHFCLEELEEAGWRDGQPRGKANYLSLLRGWAFDAEGRDAAVIKGWVESRFGLMPRYHGGVISRGDEEAYLRYVTERAAGLYNTNALEAQLDVLYAYAQYELAKINPNRTHLRLYRGVNGLSQHEILATPSGASRIMVLNSINSYTDCADRADEFGDDIIEADVPLSKIICSHRLMPSALRGEGEHLILGGVYEVRIRRT